MRPRVIFVSRVDWPNASATAQLLADLTVLLSARGWDVCVVSEDGVRTVSPGMTGPPRNLPTRVGDSIAQRLLRHALTTVHLLFRLHHILRPRDRVVVLTDPPLIGVGAAWLARRQGAALWHWCQDLYPDVAIAVSANPGIRGLLASLRPARDWSWNDAKGCVVLGSDMAQRVTPRVGVPVAVAPNWAPQGIRDVDRESARKRWNITEPWVVAYSGNLGRVHTLLPILAAAQQLRDDPRVAFVFIGEGPQRTRLVRGAAQAGLANVRFLPSQPRSDLAETLAMPDLHLITLRPGCEGTVWPSKFYGIVAAGRPMIYLGPPEAEVAGLIRDHGLGACFRPDNPGGIAETVVRWRDHPSEYATLRARVAAFAHQLPSAAQAADGWHERLQPSSLPLGRVVI